MINVSYIECSDDVKAVYHETIEPRYYNEDIKCERMEELVCNSNIQFSPFNYTDNTKKKENWDNSKQNSIWLDFDDGATIEEARDWFKEYTYLLYTTKSHQQEKKGIVCDRFRLVLPASNVPTGELYWAMMRELESLLPIDKQVNTPTGAFLGNSDAKVYTNMGKVYDCSPLLSMAQYRLSNEKKAKELKKRKRLENLEQQVYTINVQDIKNYVEKEDVLEILDELGYDVNFRLGKFKLREDERTHSAKVYQNGYIYDYGSGWKGDILDIIQDRLGIGFRDSISYLQNYIGNKHKGE